MSFVCLWTPGSPTDVAPTGAAPTAEERVTPPHESGEDAGHRLAAALLSIVPNVMVTAGGLLWADARGLPARRVAGDALRLAGEAGLAGMRAGVARTAVAARVAAMYGGAETRATVVRQGTDARFLAPFPPGVLASSRAEQRLVGTLLEIGVETCGELAALSQEAVEVRFGAEGVALWRLARADDPRRLFTTRPRLLPSASLAWEEYALRDPERLVFVANALTGTVCEGLQAWGEGARAMTLTLTLVDRSVVDRPMRAARGTADRATWLRLIRAELERVRLAAAVSALALRVDAVAGLDAPQGDFFDRGFQTARAGEAAMAQLVDDGFARVVEPVTTSHPLLERRHGWRVRELAAVVRDDETRGRRAGGVGRPEAQLVLHLLPEPQPVQVATRRRRGDRVPVRYRPAATGAGAAPVVTDVVTAAGPDRVSGGLEEGAAYAREYYHCLTSEGVLVLLFRDAAEVRTEGRGLDAARGAPPELHDTIAPSAGRQRRPPARWYLHGWWD